jgi:hypothetical protein
MPARVTFLPLVAVALTVLVDPAPAQEKAKEFAPRNGIFTAQMPAGDKTSNRSKIYTVEQHRLPMEGSATESGDTTYLAASLGIPAVLMREIPADTRFDFCRDVLVKPLQGKVTDTKDVKQDAVVGKEYLIELPKGAARLRVYTVAGWIVTAMVEGKDKEAVQTKAADAFLDGVKLTDKAQETFRRIKR